MLHVEVLREAGLKMNKTQHKAQGGKPAMQFHLLAKVLDIISFIGMQENRNTFDM
jgi:hypothetical protein